MFPFGSMLSATPPETVTLQGTAGAPVSRTDSSILDPQDGRITLAVVTTTFQTLTRGHIEWDGYVAGQSASYTSIHSWVTPNDYLLGPYYIRATLHADAAPDIGNALNVWWSLTKDSGSNVFWTWSRNQIGSNTGTLKLEIATDSQGNNIVATGYYKMTITVGA